MASVCIFCGLRASGKEHAWPQWIDRLLGRSSDQNLTMEFQVSGRSSGRGQWSAQQLDVKVGAVCIGCNTGWMSTLETRVQMFFSPMIASGAVTVLGTSAPGPAPGTVPCFGFGRGPATISCGPLLRLTPISFGCSRPDSARARSREIAHTSTRGGDQ